MTALLLLSKNGTVRHLALTDGARTELAPRFDKLAEQLDSAEEHDFEPGYKPDNDEVIALDFVLPDPLGKIQQTVPNSIKSVDPAALRESQPVALVFAKTGRSPRLIFQAIYKQQLLEKNSAILWAKNHFDLNSTSGIVVGQTIDAIHEDGRLYFKSEHKVRHFLDLGEAFRDASDEEVDDFFASRLFSVRDGAALKSAANTALRRKLGVLHRSGKSFALSDLQAAARKAKVKLDVQANKIVVPTDAKGLRTFVALLNNDYLQSLLNANEVYRTNSKRLVK